MSPSISKDALAVIGSIALAASAARADFITGTVVTSLGQPLVLVDLDAKNVGGGGGNPTLLNDGTDAAGHFLTTIPAGTYDITFTPPAGSPGLVLTIENVVVAGTTNLGTIALPAAFALSGKCVNSVGTGVPGINLDVIDAAGNNIDLPYGSTDALGNFLISVPPGADELRFDTTPVVGQSLAPAKLDLVVNANLNLGPLTLPQGYSLAGIVRNAAAVAVPNCDIDVFDASGAKLYTPNDTTSASGTFVVKVPAGSLRVEICPPFSTKLVAAAVDPVMVVGNTSLGTITLQNGVVLSGSILSYLGAPVPGADIDVFLAGSQTQVVLCNDNAASNGSYQVVVPLGTFDIVFAPPGYSVPLTKQHVHGVLVGSNKVQNGALPACPFSTSYGVGLAGSNGIVPALGSSGGAPRVGNPNYGFNVSQGLGSSFGVLAFGFGPSTLPLFGGTLQIDVFGPYTSFVLLLGGTPGGAGAGSAAKPLPVAISNALVGLSIYGQYFGLDNGAVQGISMSAGLQTTFCE